MYTQRHETIEERLATLKDDRARLVMTQQDTRELDDEIAMLESDLWR